jgi:hypothetical protein
LLDSLFDMRWPPSAKVDPQRKAQGGGAVFGWPSGSSFS